MMVKRVHLELKYIKMTMTMYKNIIRTAFLFATGIFMTACSSGDDNIADSRTIVTPDTKENTVTLTGTISTGSDITRAVDTNGKTVYWEVGDEICVQYTDKDGNYATVKGTIKEVDNSTDTKKAKFTATLTNLAPNSTTNSIGLAYPYSNVTAGKTTATDFKIKDGILAKQAGTIDGINNAKLDIAWTETAVGITIDKTTATLDNDAELSNQVCICKFNIKDTDNSTDLNARMLEITTGTNTAPDYIVTPANEQSTFYVVLPPISGNLKIEASTCGNYGAMKLDSENKLKAMKSTDVGSYISIDPTVGTDQYQAYLCKNLTTGSPAYTTAKICKHTYTGASLAKDKFYEKKLNSSEKTLTPRAVVGHVDAVSNYWNYFLALALEDATSSAGTVSGAQTEVTTWVGNHAVKINGTTYNTVAARGSNTSYDEVASGTTTSNQTASGLIQGWRVPTVTDWRYIFQSLCAGHYATVPVGVVDNGMYYEGETKPNYKALIDAKCGNTVMANHGESCIYWSGSSALDGTITKIWRYNFVHDYFMWVSTSDNSFVRTVIAY